MPVAPTQDCSHIVGRYRNHGFNSQNVSTERPWVNAPLTKLLLGHSTEADKGTEVQLLDIRNDEITVCVYTGSLELDMTWLWNATRQASCEDGKIVIKHKQFVGPESALSGGLVFSRTTLYSNQNYLFVETEEHGVAILFCLLPAVAGDTKWYRYDRDP